MTSTKLRAPDHEDQSQQKIVVVIDDDDGIRDYLSILLRTVGITAYTYDSALDFLQDDRTFEACCILLDIRMPGRSGLDLQTELGRHAHDAPIIFLSGHADTEASVQALKRGAFDFLTKPCREQHLLDAVWRALEHHSSTRRRRNHEAMLRSRYATLTDRERQVLGEVVSGQLNKQIAGHLGISEITVKVHRGQVMRKMEARCLPDLVRMADMLQPPPA